MRRSSASLVLLLAACGTPAATPAAPAEPTEVALEASAPALAEGVVEIEPGCTGGVEETCNALDDDCDGLIDEECEGALSGALAAAVAWNGSADVDLVVTGPSELERVESRGGCADEPQREQAASEALAPGRYQIELARAACGDDAPITASVTVAVNGRLLGTFNRPLASGERAPVLEFTVGPR